MGKFFRPLCSPPPRMKGRLPKLLQTLVALAGLVVGLDDAWACACCTNPGHRLVEVRTLEKSYELDVIRQVRFGSAAELFSHEVEPERVIKGIVSPSSDYDVEVAQQNDRWVWTFSNKAGRSGTLMLSMPKSITVFEVDPRQGWGEIGAGPVLYKEWQLTSPAAGTGIFAPGVGQGQSITLIVQGRGYYCASVENFTHWTLAVSGPVATYHFFGELIPPQ